MTTLKNSFLHLTIATLDKVLVEEDVSAVYFRTSNGEVGVLTNHTAYLTDTVPGRIRYKKSDNETATLDVSRPGVFFIKDNQARLWVC
jgi:F0F1-type ATP synthase epsilon subunit